MSAFRRPLLVVALVAIALMTVMVMGCQKKESVKIPAKIDVATKTVDATSTSPGTSGAPVVATGPITTPAAGTPLRTALMDAAREKFATTSQFKIDQLWSQGDTAIGEIEQITGGSGHVYVAWTGPDWTVIWTAPVGGTGAAKAAAAAALPTFSAEMLAKITWAAQTQAPVTEDEATVLAKLKAAADGWANTVMSGVGKPYVIMGSKVAKDSKGIWWGYVYIQPTADAGNSYEGLEFWCKYSGSKWTGNVQDPELPNPNTYFPTVIVEALGL